MKNHARNFVLVLLGSMLIVQGCSENRGSPARPDVTEQVGLFTLQTELGPVDVLSFQDEPEGPRNIKIHHINGEGTHVVRTIQMSQGPSLEFPDGFAYSSAIYDRDRELSRFTQTYFLDPASGFELTLETGGDRMRVKAKPDGEVYRVRYRFESGGIVREIRLELDPGRLDDAFYAREFHRRLLELYPSGTLVEDPDHLLMAAVVASPDWENYLEESPYQVQGSGKDKTKERIRRFCLIVSATAQVTCFISIFQPVVLGVCVSASLMSAGCTVYEISQIFANDENLSCPCTCMCPNN